MDSFPIGRAISIAILGLLAVCATFPATRGLDEARKIVTDRGVANPSIDGTRHCADPAAVVAPLAAEPLTPDTTVRITQHGETYAYEFTLCQHHTHMYHPNADEMTQMAVGMTDPTDVEAEPIDRDFVPKTRWRPEVTEIVGFDQSRDTEFIAASGDWALHCHMTHHTVNVMGHGISHTLGVGQSKIGDQIQSLLRVYLAMGESGMAKHGTQVAMGMLKGPKTCCR